MPVLSYAQFQRYARHIILDEIGEEGQAKLLAARVLVVGAGGLGSPALLYLAAAGVGTIGIVDDDRVDLTNLQRQIIHRQASVGRSKVESAAETIGALDPAIAIERHDLRLDATDIDRLVRAYDLVLDGSDNFATRYLVNDACVAARRTLVSAAIVRFEGQLSTFKPYAGPTHPCYRCLFPEAPTAAPSSRCEDAGILGSVAGVIGTLQATEALKELLGLGSSLSGTLLLYEALEASFYRLTVAPDPTCPACGIASGMR